MGIVTLIAEALAKIKPTSLTVHMQENQADKVIIDATRSANGDWQENHGIRPIRV